MNEVLKPLSDKLVYDDLSSLPSHEDLALKHVLRIVRNLVLLPEIHFVGVLSTQEMSWQS